MVAFTDGVQYFNTTAFGAADLAHFIKLYDLVQHNLNVSSAATMVALC